MTLSPEHKKYLWAAGILIIVILLVIGANEWKNYSEADAHPCAINFLDTFLYNVSASTTKVAVAQTLLEQYLNAYEHTPNCPADGISNYAITSVGGIQNVKTDFTAKVTFDILPLSKTKTVWATAETHWDGDWIRGKEATLGIQHITTSTSTNAISTYRLVI